MFTIDKHIIVHSSIQEQQWDVVGNGSISIQCVWYGY